MKRELRAAQLVGNGGVGAVIDMGDESFVVTDISRWRRGVRILIPRLSEKLHKPLFSPPFSGDGGTGGSVEIKRFPGSLFCIMCRFLIDHWREGELGRSDGGRPDCPRCHRSQTLTPMRFVVACKNGHLHETPWRRWAHSGPIKGNRPCTPSSDLHFRVDDKSGVGGLKSLYVECACGSRRDLEQLPGKGAMRSIGHKCPGTHPWHSETAKCEENPLVLQRGATNLHYADVVSALDIGEGVAIDVEEVSGSVVSRLRSDPLFQMLTENLQCAPTQGTHINAGAERIAGKLSIDFGIDIRTVIDLARDTNAVVVDSEEDAPVLTDALLAEEWIFLTSSQAASVSEATLVCRESPPPRFRNRLQPFSRVLLIDRLREVRAMPTFSRITPGTVRVPVDIGRLAGAMSWLPAVEVFGEGIFLQLDEEFVLRWELTLQDRSPQAIAECEHLEQVRLAENYWFLPEISPRFIAIHTFAHLLMRQMTFECGYSSSALRERIWANPGTPSAGILIYTADGDSEGALGGLVRQGQPERLGDLIVSCLEKAAWCSADPVCSETQGQGLGGFNRGACHACSLVPETSCVHANTLLNRLYVVGRHGVMPGLMEGI